MPAMVVYMIIATANTYICVYIYKCIRSHLWLKSQAETDLFSDCASPAPANSGLPQLLSPP